MTLASRFEASGTRVSRCNMQPLQEQSRSRRQPMCGNSTVHRSDRSQDTAGTQASAKNIFFVRDWTVGVPIVGIGLN